MTTEGFPLPPGVDRAEYERGLRLVNGLVVSLHTTAERFNAKPVCGGRTLAVALLHSGIVGLVADDVDLAELIALVSEVFPAAKAEQDVADAEDNSAKAGGPV